MNQLANLNEFEPTKANIETLAQLIAQEVEEGNVNPIDYSVKLTAIIEVCEAAKAKIAEQTLNELDKNGGKAVALGAKVERKEVGTKWSYNNAAWSYLKSLEDGYSEKRKQVEKICQNIPEGTQVNWTDEGTGETFTLQRGVKTSKTSFAITLGK